MMFLVFRGYTQRCSGATSGSVLEWRWSVLVLFEGQCSVRVSNPDSCMQSMNELLFCPLRIIILITD